MICTNSLDENILYYYVLYMIIIHPRGKNNEMNRGKIESNRGGRREKEEEGGRGRKREG